MENGFGSVLVQLELLVVRQELADAQICVFRFTMLLSRRCLGASPPTIDLTV